MFGIIFFHYSILFTQNMRLISTPLCEQLYLYYWLLLWHITSISKQAKSSKYSKVLVNNTLWMEIYWYDRNTSFVFNVIYITVIQCNLELLCAHLSSWMQKLPLIVQINACGCCGVMKNILIHLKLYPAGYFLSYNLGNYLHNYEKYSSCSHISSFFCLILTELKFKWNKCEQIRVTNSGTGRNMTCDCLESKLISATIWHWTWTRNLNLANDKQKQMKNCSSYLYFYF